MILMEFHNLISQYNLALILWINFECFKEDIDINFI